MANLDPVNNIKKEADVASARMLLGKTEAAIISIRLLRRSAGDRAYPNVKTND